MMNQSNPLRKIRTPLGVRETERVGKGTAEREEQVKRLEEASGRPVLLTSAAMGQGLDQLLQRVWAELGIDRS